ncbi:effector binding domain-containing protein [Lysinibacillus sp. RSDA_15]|nr:MULTISPECIES: zinc ribbon domain-containing protein [Lysinibacillus]MBG9709487.1 transcriptional regulator [Lysinibacillus sphaericus]MBG9725377.1 transcriptional regulator [Lysinibacillus fusiformis]MBG9729688.1 transcriptional regulator [Lysinibacillus sphaericus]MBG9739609.1 transcriptional regulator [Lysinibacillus sphaericus]MCS1397729.1 zinc ribbon domain-containing protein [Lysinibacillus sp. PB211]
MMQSYCQSCGMPLTDEALLGTEKEGHKNQDYCTYCYEEGSFKQPNLTVEEMIDICVPHLKGDGMPANEARTMLTSFLPSLKRWRKQEWSEPKIIKREAFQIIGISTKTSNANELTAQAKIPQLWQDFYEKNIVDQLSKLDNQNVYGLYSDYETDVNGNYAITIGVEASKMNDASPEWVIKTIPAAKYLVFTSHKGKMPEIVIQTWQEIWAWFANSKVERTYTGDFELYDERCANPQEAQVEVYIAIK